MVSPEELQRQLGVTYKCAHRMGTLIRKHMAAIDGDEKLGGEGQIVEVDETYVGGAKKGQRGRSPSKTVVFGMVERGGDALIKVVPNATKATLERAIAENIEKGTEIHADSWKAYDDLGDKGYELKRINKKRDGEWVGEKGETVNSVENFWRHLKSAIKGTHISVAPKYLERYAKEFEYRFNRRMRPETMLDELLTRFPELDV
jgi:transposase-like protein